MPADCRNSCTVAIAPLSVSDRFCIFFRYKVATSASQDSQKATAGYVALDFGQENLDEFRQWDQKQLLITSPRHLIGVAYSHIMKPRAGHRNEIGRLPAISHT